MAHLVGVLTVQAQGTEFQYPATTLKKKNPGIAGMELQPPSGVRQRQDDCWGLMELISRFRRPCLEGIWRVTAGHSTFSGLQLFMDVHMVHIPLCAKCSKDLGKIYCTE